MTNIGLIILFSGVLLAAVAYIVLGLQKHNQERKEVAEAARLTKQNHPRIGERSKDLIYRLAVDNGKSPNSARTRSDAIEAYNEFVDWTGVRRGDVYLDFMAEYTNIARDLAYLANLRDRLTLVHTAL